MVVAILLERCTRRASFENCWTLQSSLEPRMQLHQLHLMGKRFPHDGCSGSEGIARDGLSVGCQCQCKSGGRQIAWREVNRLTKSTHIPNRLTFVIEQFERVTPSGPQSQKWKSTRWKICSVELRRALSLFSAADRIVISNGTLPFTEGAFVCRVLTCAPRLGPSVCCCYSCSRLRLISNSAWYGPRAAS